LKKEEDYYWNLIEKVDWPTIIRLKTERFYGPYNELPYTVGRKLLTEKFKTWEEADKFNRFAKEKASNLRIALKDISQTLGLGDDGYSDLIWHIVGCGKKEFEAVMSNPYLAVKRSKNGDFGESFLYCLPRKTETNYETKDKEKAGKPIC